MFCVKTLETLQYRRIRFRTVYLVGDANWIKYPYNNGVNDVEQDTGIN